MEVGWEVALFSNIYLSPIQADSEPFHPRECVCVCVCVCVSTASWRESSCLIDVIS